MAKYQNDLMLDAGLAWLQDSVIKMGIYTAQPVSLAECTASTALAFSGALTTGSFVIADDSTNGGRKLTVAAQATLAVVTTGVASHVALFSSVGTTGLHYVVTCITQALPDTSGKVTVPAFKITLDDAT